MGLIITFFTSRNRPRVLLLGIAILLTAYQNSIAQIVRTGLTAGVQACWVSLDDASFRDTVSISPVPGFRAGAVASFKVKDRFFLHTEYVYAQKGKIAKGKLSEVLHDKVTYHYLEVPILFTMHFKGQLGKDRTFKWYLGAGPTISYWLGGKGSIRSDDLQEVGVDEMDYTIKFGTRPDDTRLANNFYYSDVNRWQLGLDVGAGLLLEPANGRVVLIDLRYGFDQTRLGKDGSADIQNPADYKDNLKARNRSLKLSVSYLLEFNLNKKSRNKGKSTIKPKHR